MVLSVRQLNVAFGQNVILDNLSFSVKQGELVALVGASGSGKSTLMNTLMKAVSPTSGEILLENQPISSISDPKRYAQYVGMLHQQYHLVKQLDVVHNVLAGRLNQWGVGRALLSLLKPQEKALAQAALQAVGLAEKLTEPTANLSGGEQQRVAIARLLVQNPKLILADEPISALDPVNAHKVLALLTDLVRTQHKTLIASMHSVEHAKHYFDRMIGLKSGKICFDLPASEVSDTLLQQLYGVA